MGMSSYKKITLQFKRLQNQPEPKIRSSYLKSQMQFELHSLAQGKQFCYFLPLQFSHFSPSHLSASTTHAFSLSFEHFIEFYTFSLQGSEIIIEQEAD